MVKYNEFMAEDLERLRDELYLKASTNQWMSTSALAEIVWKINSCLYKGYPRKHIKSDIEATS